MLISLFQDIFKNLVKSKLINKKKNGGGCKINNFLIKRFDNSQLSGLYLTLAFIVFVSILLLLLGVTEDFIEQDFIVQIDYWVAKNIALVRTEVVVDFLDFHITCFSFIFI